MAQEARPLTSKAVSKDKPHTHPADPPVIDGNVINIGDAKNALGAPVPIAPIALPFNDQKLRPLTNHRGKAYRMVDVPDQQQILEHQVRLLETEHFGLVRGMSTVPHAIAHEEGETSNEAQRRFFAERLPHVEAELDRLYDELDALNAQED